MGDGGRRFEACLADLVKTVAVLVPVLDRPARVAPLLDSVLTYDPRQFPVFLCSPGDKAEIDAVHSNGAAAIVVPWERGPGDYARKINLGFSLTGTDWVFLGADDLTFHEGWFDECLHVYERTGACVIGTNDLGNARVMRGDHATHSLVHRDYNECGTIDDASMILHEGYDHQWVDNEFVETAKSRGTFAFASGSHVEHLHPFWGKGTMDATYRMAQDRGGADQQLYARRRRLWE